jgi:minor extracellular serine protease Vpr
VTIGGVTAPLKFSGMAPGYVGLWQINADVPASVAPSSAVPLSVSIGGTSSNTVTIAVQ